MRRQTDNTVHEMTPEEETEYLAALDAAKPSLTRYSNELTGANDTTLEEATETLIKKLKEGK